MLGVVIALLLTSLFVFYLMLFVIAFGKIRNSNNTFTFIYSWAFWLGAFVWEDLLIFLIYHLSALTAVVLLHDMRVGLLMAAVFWIVRSTGETIYFFLQQFHLPQHHPHVLDGHFGVLQKIFGVIGLQKAYIIMQTLHQTIVMFALSAVIYLLLYWNTLPSWFAS